jgi:arylsulfatase A-like enzyme
MCFRFRVLIPLLSLSGCLLLSSGSGNRDPRHPNIILILADDLGWKDTGFMGSEFYETPNLDNLASEGMVFTQAYAGASNCSPSRACLMSGQRRFP